MSIWQHLVRLERESRVEISSAWGLFFFFLIASEVLLLDWLMDALGLEGGRRWAGIALIAGAAGLVMRAAVLIVRRRRPRFAVEGP
jgi:hypothetical protein